MSFALLMERRRIALDVVFYLRDDLAASTVSGNQCRKLLMNSIFGCMNQFLKLSRSGFGSRYQSSHAMRIHLDLLDVRTADAKLKQLSPLSVTNLQIVKDRPHQRSNRKIPGGTVRHFDNNDPSYSWLM
ncbi:hypothetical protein Gohar_027036, partial [Gossypium harknessii]|nr:hypothetical protein [Gossypium harknessii]